MSVLLPLADTPRLALGCPFSASKGLMRFNKVILFDHLVGADEHCRWHDDTERLGSLQIDHQFEFGGLFGRQVRRLRTLENLVNEACGTTIWLQKICSVA